MSTWHQGDSCAMRRHETYLTAVSGDSCCWLIAIVRAWNAVIRVSAWTTRFLQQLRIRPIRGAKGTTF